MIAIIPSAGKGTRMEAVTGGKPKELLPLGTKPVLLRVLEEARASDPDEIVVVTAKDKDELNQQLEAWGKSEFADIPFRITYQDPLNGLAGAVAAAGAEDDVIVLVGDCAFAGGSPVERMSNLIYRGLDGCVAVQDVPESEMSRYGIMELDEGVGAVRRIMEKPEPSETTSRWAVAGRFAFAKPVVGFINEYISAHAGENREISLSEVLSAAITQGIDIRAVPVEKKQKRVDCGSPEEYEKAARLQWD